MSSVRRFPASRTHIDPSSGVLPALLLATTLALAAATAAVAQTCGAAGGDPRPVDASPGAPESLARSCASPAEPASLTAALPPTAVGNPVDVVTGNKYLRAIDLALPATDTLDLSQVASADLASRAGAARFAQDEAPLALADGVTLGVGWRTDAPLALAFTRHYNARNAFARSLGPGWSHAFDTRLVERAVRAEVQIVQGDGRRIVLRAGGKRRWRGVDPADGIVVRTGPGGGWTWRWPGGRELHFDALGRLARIVGADGDALQIVRDASGRIGAVRDHAGRRLRMQYRASRLVAVTATGLGTVRFDYDAHGRLVSATHPDGRIVRYRYDDPRAWERLTAVVDADGRESAYRYDDGGRVVFSRGIGEPAGIALHYALPRRAGGVGETRVVHAAGAARYRWRYDTHTHRAMLLEGAGVACRNCPQVARRYRYDARHRLAGQDDTALHRDALGRVVAVTREVAGSRQQWRVRYASSDPLAPAAEIDAPSGSNGSRHRIRLRRDERGRLVRREEHGRSPARGAPIVRVATFAYLGSGPAAGKLAGVRHGASALAFHYDDHRRLVAIEAAPDVVHAFARDDAGRVVGEYLPVGVTRATAFDAIGRPVLRRVAGRDFPLRAGTQSQRRRSGRDAASEPTGRSWPAGPRGAPAVVPVPIGLSARGPDGFVFVDADGGVTRQRFDDFGRLVHERSPAFGERWFAHDDAGRLAEIRYDDGSLDRHQHDGAGRLVAREQRAGDEAVHTRIRYRGLQVVAVEHPVMRTRATWGEQARVTRIEQVAFGRRYVQTFAHDALGRLVEHGLPDGSAVVYRYDPGGRIARLGWRAGGGHAPTWLALARADDASPARSPRHDSFGLGNGLVEVRRYRDDGRPMQIEVARAGARGEALLRWNYAWDRAGRPLAIAHDRYVDRFAFDRAGRLVVRERTPARQATSRSRPTVAAASPGAGGVEYFAWSAAGTLRAARGDDGIDRRFESDGRYPAARLGVRHLRYGAQRRLQVVTAPGGGTVARYRYGAMGERVESVVDGGHRVRRFLHHRRQLLAELDAAGEITRLYLHRDGLPFVTIDRVRGPGGRVAHRIHYLHTDHLGTPHAASDAQGRLAWRGRYAAFGGLVAESGAYRQPLRLPGQYADAETGLHENFLRHYDPVRARYLEPDPLGLAAGPNLRAYAGGDPLTRIDPLGLILFAFDGTGNDPSSRTNVYEFARLYDSGEAFDAAAGYDGAANYVPGVGTGGGVSDNALTGGALALGLRERVDTQLARLDGYVQARFESDAAARAVGPDAPVSVTVDIVGFSRGAAAARDFANRLLARRDTGHYRDLVGGGCVRVDVRFMGLFDTVLSAHLGEVDLRIPEAVGYVASAVAANEHRERFSLESIYPSNDARDTAGNRLERSFIGAHADIGGGYACEPAGSPSCDGGDLSDVALAWMIAQARAQGVAFDEIPDALRVVSRPVLHDERTQWAWFDPDPVSDREVRFNATSQTSPAVAPVATAPGGVPTGAGGQLATGSAPAAPQPSRVAIDDGMTSGLSARFVRADATPTPGRVGTVDLDAYLDWLARQPGYRLDAIERPVGA